MLMNEVRSVRLESCRNPSGTAYRRNKPRPFAKQRPRSRCRARHPIDVRLSVPVPGGSRAYFVLLAGREKRSSARREMERLVRPGDPLGQAILLGPCGAALCVAGLIGVLILRCASWYSVFAAAWLALQVLVCLWRGPTGGCSAGDETPQPRR